MYVCWWLCCLSMDYPSFELNSIHFPDAFSFALRRSSVGRRIRYAVYSHRLFHGILNCGVICFFFFLGFVEKWVLFCVVFTLCSFFSFIWGRWFYLKGDSVGVWKLLFSACGFCNCLSVNWFDFNSSGGEGMVSSFCHMFCSFSWINYSYCCDIFVVFCFFVCLLIGSMGVAVCLCLHIIWLIGDDKMLWNQYSCVKYLFLVGSRYFWNMVWCTWMYYWFFSLVWKEWYWWHVTNLCRSACSFCKMEWMCLLGLAYIVIISLEIILYFVCAANEFVVVVLPAPAPLSKLFCLSLK